MKQLCATILAICLMAAPAAFGDIVGFSDPGGFTLNANDAALGEGMPAIVGDELQITSGANSQATSAFFNVKQGVEIFTAEFDYQLVSGTAQPADGAAFVIQNVGTSALGAGGGGRGYLNISDSVAVSLNLWQGRSDIDQGLNGSMPQGGGDGGADAARRHPTAPVDILSGNPIHTTVEYDGSTIMVGLEDLVTGDAFSTSWAEDIRGAVGDGMAYVGFSGGTGGANADQRITNFAYSGVAIATLTWNEGGTDFWNSANWDGGPPEMPDAGTHAVLAATNTDTVFVSQLPTSSALTLTADGGEVVVVGGQSLNVLGQTNFGPGATLTLQDGASLWTGGGKIADLNATAGNTMIVNSGDLAVDNLLGNVLPSTAGVFTKAGAGTLTLDNSTGLGVIAPRSTFRVAEGTLVSAGADPLGGSASIELAGGTLKLSAGQNAGAGPAGALAHWSFDDTVADSTGTYNGTIMGDAQFTSKGITGGALEFDGVGDYVDLPDGFDDFSGGISVAVWAKPEAMQNWSRLMDFGNGAGVDCILIANRGTTTNFQWEIYGANPGNQALIVDGAFDVGAWQHFVTTVDAAGNAVIYKNGQPILTSTQKLPETVVRTNNYIGESNWGGDDFYKGLMDEMYVYDRALTGAEVATMYGEQVLEVSDKQVVVTQDSTLEVVAEATAAFGPLTMKGGALTTKAGPAGISFAGTTVDPSVTRAGFDPQTATDYGVISVASPGVTLAKTGPSTWNLDSVTVSDPANISWQVDGGTLQTTGTAALAGRPITVAGGAYEVLEPSAGQAADITLAGGTLKVAGEFTAGAGPAGAIAHWAFDDAGGSATAADSTGNYDGTVIGNATFGGAGMSGGALEFDGVDDYVDLPDGFDDFSGGITVALWAKPASMANWSRFMDFANGPGSDNILLANQGTSNNLVWEIHGTNPGDQRLTAAGSLDVGEWQHLVATVDADGNAAIYKNGEAILTSTQKLPFNVVRTNNFIGESNWGGDAFYHGLMDEMYIYDRALTAGEVAATYGNATADLSDANVVVTADSLIDVGAAGSISLGNLAIDGGVQLALSNGASASFADVNAGDGASVVGNLGVRSVLSVGNSVGTLDVTGDLTLADTSTYTWELEAGGSDLINVSGDLAVADGWTLKIVTDQEPAGEHLLFTYGGMASVGAATFDVSEASGWDAGLLAVVDDGAGNVSLTVIPEPGTLILLVSGGLGLLLALRSRRRGA